MTQSSNMISISEALSLLFEKAINEAYPDLTDPPVVISMSNNPKLGDYQCNSALPLMKLLSTSGPQGNLGDCKILHYTMIVKYKKYRRLYLSIISISYLFSRKTKIFTENHCRKYC